LHLPGATTYQFDNGGDIVVGYGTVVGSEFNKQDGVEKEIRKAAAVTQSYPL
jgi:hypothetical protein